MPCPYVTIKNLIGNSSIFTQNPCRPHHGRYRVLFPYEKANVGDRGVVEDIS